MRLDDFDYALPPELVALRPVRPRPASRLLVADAAGLHDSTVARLEDWLAPGDMLVFNDTRVIPARLRGVRRRGDGAGTAVEATLVAAAGEGLWRVLARPGKRLAVGDRIDFGGGSDGGGSDGGGLSAEVRDKEGAEILLAFDRAGAALDRAIEATGEMPLPPYIAARRRADAQDRDDYQTIFAARPGAVAAPTAALHFDEALVAGLAARGVLSARLTLHVGAGTFLPVKVEDVETHRMHAEWGEIGPEAAEAINAAPGRVIPVGTTALRLLETAAAGDGRVAPWSGETDIFIRPGFRFRVADGLMTNFHLPKSTLLMLVAALIGMEPMRAVYAHAVAARYRFFSYGDASLLLPRSGARPGSTAPSAPGH